MTEKNLTMLCDFYELTMGNGYFQAGAAGPDHLLDMFFRNVPDKGGYAICAGLEQLIDYIQNLHFDQADIDYLRGRKLFSEEVPGLPPGLPLHRGHLGGAGGDPPSSPGSRW